MEGKATAVAVTIAFSLVGVLGDYFLRLASAREDSFRSPAFYVGFALYASTAFGWLFVMKHLKLATIGVPSLLVPWGGAAHDHQSRNAAWLGDAGAATVVPEERFDDDALATEVSRLITDPSAAAAMATAARACGALHRSGALIDLIEEVAAR